MRCIVLGLGNPVLSDDSVGLKVARKVRETIKWPGVEIIETTASGLDFLEILTGYDKAILIDAIQTAGGCPGQVARLNLDSIASTRHASSPHDVNLATALELGHKLQMDLPEDITIFAIEAGDVVTLSETCTEAVEAAIPGCVEMVVKELALEYSPQIESRVAGYSVLIVDDERIMGESLRDCLADSGARVSVAETGEEALKILSIQDFDLMIIDYRLPGMDGLAVLNKVRSLEYPLKSIFITAYPSSELAVQAKRLGVAGFLAKPIDLIELENLIQSVLFDKAMVEGPLSNQSLPS
jgi:hydrogenase maturation protease